VKVLEEFDQRPIQRARACHGDVRVNRQIVGFKKVKFYTLENVGAGNLSMPEQEMHTTAWWLHCPAEFLAQLTEFSPSERANGLAGLANALRAVASMLVMCDPRDIGTSLTEEIAGGLVAWEPNLYLYDT
jgi:DEAD/DEAH box helicase domain-containing protein